MNANEVPLIGVTARSTPASPPAPHLPSPEVIDAEFVDVPRRHLRDHLRVLSRYRRPAGIVGGGVLGLVVVATLLLPRWYTATMRIQVVHEPSVQLRLQSNVLQVDESDRTVNGTSSFLQTQLAALESRDLAERVIRTHHLVDHPAVVDPGAGGGPLGLGDRILGIFRPRGWVDDASVAPVAPVAESETIDPLLLDDYTREWLAVRDMRGTDVIEIGFTTRDPRLSAFLAAAHVQAYMESNDDARLATGVTAREFLSKQRQEADARAHAAEAALDEFASAHPNIAVNQEQQLVAQRIAELSSLQTTAHGERVGLQTRYEFLAQPGRDALPYFSGEPSVQKIEAALSGVRLQRAAVIGRLGPNHPEMQELGREEADLLQQRRAEVQGLVASVRMQFDASTARENGLQQTLSRAEEQQVKLRELGTRYDLLRAETESARALQQSLLKQQAETAVSSELLATNVRVLERAEVPAAPASPRLPVNFGIGLALGALAAVGTAFGCEYFDRSVKSSDEVAGLLQLPTLAIVPNFAPVRAGDRGGRGELVVIDQPRSAAAEAFRILRTAVLPRSTEARSCLLVITSGTAGEGKTTISANLASALAESGERVLLVDADLRRPACHRMFGVENHYGLSTLLAGEADLGSLIHPVGAGKLAFLAAGPPPANPAELVSSARMRETLETLRGRYDCVIVDTPPALPVTDAVVLAREADGVLLVLKGQTTPREIVQRARDQLTLAGARLLGTVVNGVDFRWGDLQYLYRRGDGAYRRRSTAEDRA